MNRRGFLGSLAALMVVPFVPIVAPPTVPALAVHPDAFSLVMAPLQIGDRISIRVPQRFNGTPASLEPSDTESFTITGMV